MGVFFGLFCLICLTIVPLAIRLFIRGQVSIGNGDLPPIRWLRVHENAAVFAAWGFFFLGLAIIWAPAREDILNEFLQAMRVETTRDTITTRHLLRLQAWPRCFTAFLYRTISSTPARSAYVTSDMASPVLVVFDVYRK